MFVSVWCNINNMVHYINLKLFKAAFIASSANILQCNLTGGSDK